jgi:cell wall-associated NlpC family hydrolase
MSTQQSEVPLTQASLQQMARQAAVSEGLNPAVFMALIGQESSWQPNALSPAGAQGLGQLMPATARSLGVTNPNDPTQNLRGSARYLKQQLDAFGGNYNLALAAYNAGPEAVRKYGGIPPYAETQAYVKSITGNGGKYTSAAPASATPANTSSAVVDTSAPYQTSGVPQVAPLGDPTVRNRSMLVPQTTYTPGAMRNIQTLIPPMQLPGLMVRQPSDLTKWIQNMGAKVNPAVGNALKSLTGLMKQPLQLPGLPTATTTPTKLTVPEVTLPGGGVHITTSPHGTLGVTYTQGAKESSAANHAVALAHEYLGTPYVFGGESTSGFDCSGLLQYIWAKQNVSIPRTTYDQFTAGTPVAQKNLVPGDAVFFKGSDPQTRNGKMLPGHVGIYIGNGDIIQAPHTGAKVEITPLSSMNNYMGARRYA